MATISDPNRAAFVQQEYRYVIETDATVLARNKSARTVEVTTNLMEDAGASALARAYLTDNAAPRVFEVVIEGVTFLDSFFGQVPSFTLNFPKYRTDIRPAKVIGFTTDYETNTTTLQVRG